MKESFVDWLVKNVPYYNSLAEEETTKLKELYESVQKALIIERRILDKALNSPGKDYGKDFEDAMTVRADLQRNLAMYKKELDGRYGSLQNIVEYSMNK